MLALPKHRNPPDGAIQLDVEGVPTVWVKLPRRGSFIGTLQQALLQASTRAREQNAVAAFLGYCWAPVTHELEADRPDLDVASPIDLYRYGGEVTDELLDAGYSEADIGALWAALAPSLREAVAAINEEVERRRKRAEAVEEKAAFTEAPRDGTA